jgi:hypothetical protein
MIREGRSERAGKAVAASEGKRKNRVVDSTLCALQKREFFGELISVDGDPFD